MLSSSLFLSPHRSTIRRALYIQMVSEPLERIPMRTSIPTLEHTDPPIWPAGEGRLQRTLAIAVVGLDVPSITRDTAWRAALPSGELRTAQQSDGASRVRWSARAALRLLLAAELEADPRQLRIASDERGKPRLIDHPELCFNLSHSSSRAAFALSRRGAVGIDIERLRPRARAVAIARRRLADGCALQLEQAEPQERERAFYGMWTIHEAFAKALGTGLQTDLRRATLAPGPPWPASIGHPNWNDADWHYRPLAIDGYALAVVAQGPDWEASPRIRSLRSLLESER